MAKFEKSSPAEKSAKESDKPDVPLPPGAGLELGKEGVLPGSLPVPCNTGISLCIA
jgi:hypothetical protein